MEHKCNCKYCHTNLNFQRMSNEELRQLRNTFLNVAKIMTEMLKYPYSFGRNK